MRVLLGLCPEKTPKPPALYFPCSFPSSCCLWCGTSSSPPGLTPAWLESQLDVQGKGVSRAGMALGARSTIPAPSPLHCCQDKHPSMSRLQQRSRLQLFSKDLATSFNFPSFNPPKMETHSIFANPGPLPGLAVVKGSTHHGENIWFCH